jgi:hypothetical protein
VKRSERVDAVVIVILVAAGIVELGWWALRRLVGGPWPRSERHS